MITSFRFLRTRPAGLLGLFLVFAQAFAAPDLPTHAEPGAPARIVEKPRKSPRVTGIGEISVQYDLVVYGATPGGIACAVRAAREGLSVLVVDHSQHVGGMMSNGLSVMDALYAGARAPIYEELRWAIHDYYRITYGPDSPQFAASRPGHPKAYYEAHVAEQLFIEMLGKETGIALVLGFYPSQAKVSDRTLHEVAFMEHGGDRKFSTKARVFSDCSYEADLAKVAGVPYRVGREGRTEFNEEHAGKIFLRRVLPWPPADVDPKRIARYKELNLFHYDRWFEVIRPESTGEGDKAIQGYNIRAVLTADAENRYIPTTPPEGYDPALMRDIWNKKPPYSQLLGPLPNQKFLWNMPELIGAAVDYPDGSPEVREKIIKAHQTATAGMLYYLQNDPEVAPAEREQWKGLGFAKDEFTDNKHMPYEAYARETRRIKGRSVFTENDARLLDGLDRTPVHGDSISITDWFIDSHSCNLEHTAGSLWEGELYLNYVSHPAQVPYRTILPGNLDNLMVPVCLSSTHVGWGAIRLEPTWMSICESAAHAAVLSVENEMPPSAVSADKLVKRLADRRIMVSFFNDVSVASGEAWVPAVQYLGTCGFFGSYDASPSNPVTAGLAEVWAAAAADWMNGKVTDANGCARKVLAAEAKEGGAITQDEFLVILSRSLTAASVPFTPADSRVSLGGRQVMSRGKACQIIYEIGSRVLERRK